MTADHGQVCVDPRRTVYVNRLPQLPDIGRFLRRSPRDGGPIKFGGSCRDMFLYVEDAALEEVEAGLRQAVGGRGEVWRVDELLREGFFGSAPSERLRKRLGNLVVLPYDGESAYWYEEGRFDMHYFGHHGGLTPLEMDTGALPSAAVRPRRVSHSSRNIFPLLSGRLASRLLDKPFRLKPATRAKPTASPCEDVRDRGAIS